MTLGCPGMDGEEDNRPAFKEGQGKRHGIDVINRPDETLKGNTHLLF